MLHHIKRLTKHSAVYGAGHILTRFIGFLLLPLHTNYLIPADMGTAALLFSTLAILNVIFGYGLDVAFLRYFILEENQRQKKLIFSTAFITILSTGFIFCLALLYFDQSASRIIFRNSENIILIRYAAIILLADALVLLPFLSLRALEKSVWFLSLKFLNVAANFGFNILFVGFMKRGVEGVFLANAAASVLTLIIMIPIILKWIIPVFDTGYLKRLLSFGLPYLPSALSILIMDQISRFFLERMIGLEATGIFSAAYKLGMFMALVVSAFRFAWHPFFLGISKQENAPAVFARVLTYFIVITSLIFLGIWFFINEIVSVRIAGFTLLGEKYIPGIPIVPVVMIAYIFMGIYVNLNVGVFIKNKSKALPFITGAGAVISLAANYLLIPAFGIHGAAAATLLAYASMALLLYIYSLKIYPVKYEWVRIFKIVCVTALCYFTYSLTGASESFLLKIMILAFYPMLLILSGFLRSEEIAVIKRLPGRKNAAN